MGDSVFIWRNIEEHDDEINARDKNLFTKWENKTMRSENQQAEGRNIKRDCGYNSFVDEEYEKLRAK